METGVPCSFCKYIIYPSTTPFVTCDICAVAPICTRCMMKHDVLICEACVENQKAQLKAAEERKRNSLKCNRCKGMCKALHLCGGCTISMCYACYENIEKHPCQKCKGPGHWHLGTQWCCGKKWCDKCFEVYHKTVNCPKHMYYVCRGCGNRTLMFGDDCLRCPVPGCWNRFGCAARTCGGQYLGNPRPPGLYCFEHISKNDCPGCHHRYTFDRGYGWVRLDHLKPGTRMRREYCGPCLDRIRALVESLLIVCKRNRIVVVKVVMDMIVMRALPFL